MNSSIWVSVESKLADRPLYCMYLYECVFVHSSSCELLHERKSSAAGLNPYIPHDISTICSLLTVLC